MTAEEHIRHTLLRTLYGTRSVRVASSFLVRSAVRDCACTEDQAAAEIAYLLSAGMATTVTDSMGPTQYYAISADGTLAFERGH